MGPREIQAGAHVFHKSRRDLGKGTIVELCSDDRCTVVFGTSKFSGIRIDAVTAAERAVADGNPEVAGTACKVGRARSSEIERHFAKWNVSSLWYIVHSTNVESILKHGILNHYEAQKLNPHHVDISDPDAQKWRERREPIFNRKIHDYVPLYFNQKNPMLYVRRARQPELCLLEVPISVLVDNEFVFTDGNAASRDTCFYRDLSQLQALPWDVLQSPSWNGLTDGKRKRCAEILVHPKIAPEHIGALHCYSVETLDAIENTVCKTALSRSLFF